MKKDLAIMFPLLDLADHHNEVLTLFSFFCFSYKNEVNIFSCLKEVFHFCFHKKIHLQMFFSNGIKTEIIWEQCLCSTKLVMRKLRKIVKY